MQGRQIPQVGIFFALNFLPCELLLIKKLEIKKSKTTFVICISFKSCLLVGPCFFFISNFSIHKNFQGRKLSAKKIPTFGNSALLIYLSIYCDLKLSKRLP